MNSPGFDNVAYEETSQVATQMNKIDNNMYYEVPVQPAGKNNKKAKEARGLKTKKCTIVLAVSVVVVAMAVVAACIGLALEISSLKSDMALVQQDINSVSEFLNSSHQEFEEEIVKNVVDPFFSELNKRMEFLKNITLLGKFPEYPVTSCAAVETFPPSGYYWVRASNGSAVRLYCDMTRSCGGVTGGWMRVAHLDMTDCEQQCPSGLDLQIYENLRTCVINITDRGACSHVTLPSSMLRYSRVCGRIKAYRVETTDAFADHGRGTNLNINENYVDGVSVTHGNPRQHIWTFAASQNCGNCELENVPAFVRPDYFCDTGSGMKIILWDGAGCGPMNTCSSSSNTPPWFYKQLPQPTTDDIEMRVCRDQERSDEDIAIERIDIFVR